MKHGTGVVVNFINKKKPKKPHEGLHVLTDFIPYKTEGGIAVSIHGIHHMHECFCIFKYITLNEIAEFILLLSCGKSDVNKDKMFVEIKDHYILITETE